MSKLFAHFFASHAILCDDVALLCVCVVQPGQYDHYCWLKYCDGRAEAVAMQRKFEEERTAKVAAEIQRKEELIKLQ